MTSFALITEGVTDQEVIENILFGFFGDDIDVNPLQPPLDITDRNDPERFGGWQMALEYCGSAKFEQAFQFNEYVVIQIDTDDSQEQPFNVPHLEAGKTLSVEYDLRVNCPWLEQKPMFCLLGVTDFANRATALGYQRST